jgi:hypothetical protein
MITQTIELLQSHPFYNISNLVEIAKGKNEIPVGFKAIKTKWIRKYKYKG